MKQDKKEKRTKPEKPAAKPDPSEGKYKPFEQFGAAAVAEEEQEAAEAKKKTEDANAEIKKKTDAAKAEAKDKDEKDKKASLFEYIDEVRKRHPGFPDHRVGELKAAKTCGEAKRIIKAWLQSQSTCTVVWKE